MDEKKRDSNGKRFVAPGRYQTVVRNGKTIQSVPGKQRIELSNDHSSSTHPWPANKPGQNWLEKKGVKLPPFIKRVAKHIMADSGYSQSRAIAAAISQCKKGRLGAKGLAAAAQWEAIKRA
jgi:hypothetical protein